MQNHRPTRRRFLALSGTAVLGGIAGCAEPQSRSSIEGASSSPSFEYDGEASGTIYTEIYKATIDSVAQVRVFGIGDGDGVGGRGQGSAFLYDDHYVVTNEHVVAGGDEIDLQYINGDWTDSRLVGTDFFSDLAVLEVDHVPPVATPLELSEERPVPGMEVLAIGNPFGLEGSMSAGIVSGINRSLDVPGRAFSFPNVIQTDAGVNPGNSGGPLVDMDGSVVGVVNAAGGENIGFAISAALTLRVVPALIADGEYHHSYMGITLDSVDRIVAEENGLAEAMGVIVVDIDPDGPAGDSALEGSDDTTRRHGATIPIGGDVIIEIDGEPIPDRHSLSTHLALETSPGDTITTTVIRNGSEETVELMLGTRPSPD